MSVVSSPARRAVTPQSKQSPKPTSKAVRHPTSLVEVTSETSSNSESSKFDGSMVRLQSFNIPKWSAAEDDGGILAGLKSPQWLHRHCAIKSLNAFCRSHDQGEILTSQVLAVVKQYSKGFKDSNVNIMKSTFELFLSFCAVHVKASAPFPTWACKDGVAVAADKVADKKLSTFATSLLTVVRRGW